MNAKTPLVALSMAAILLSAQTPHQEAIPAFEAVAMAPNVGVPGFEHQLHLDGVANELMIIGGNVGDYCALVVGEHMTDVPLPGNALLRVEPLAVFVLGRFENGQFNVPLRYNGKTIDPVSVLVQALTLYGDTGMFGSSDVGAIDFDGTAHFEFRYVGQ